MAAFQWSVVLEHLGLIALAYALALPLAWNRERYGRSAGLRTFPLVAIASCGYVLLGRAALEGSEAEARVVEGLMTGIGFIGGGAILKHHATTRGTATAASIWTTGAIGAAVAYKLFEIAAVLACINYATFWVLTPLKKEVEPRRPAERDGAKAAG
ncbi:MAG: MgtC/SapB family protein [Vicinamibacterales bacterium]